MKVLAFADPHGHAPIFEKLGKRVSEADVVCCCGDFTVFGNDMKHWLDVMEGWGKTVLLIHGNHESADQVKRACKGLKNVLFIHKSYHVIDDVGFIGFGGDGFSRDDPAAEVHVKAAANILKGKKIVVLFHQPPYGTKLDHLEYYGHVGNESYTKAIVDVQPILAISGHLHETFGKRDTLGKTRLINPGPLGVMITL